MKPNVVYQIQARRVKYRGGWVTFWEHKSWSTPEKAEAYYDLHAADLGVTEEDGWAHRILKVTTTFEPVP